MTLRKFLGFGPSRFEMLEQAQQRERELMNELLDAERTARRELIEATSAQQAELLKAMASSSNVFGDYLKLVTSAGAPRVRTMDDSVEALHEAERRKSSDYAPRMKSLRELGKELVATKDMTSLAQDFETLKADLGL